MARAIRIESGHKLVEGINKTFILPSIMEGDNLMKLLWKRLATHN